MNIKEIKSKAPEEATHYLAVFGMLAYYKVVDGKIYAHTPQGWKLCGENFLFKKEIKAL